MDKDIKLLGDNIKVIYTSHNVQTITATSRQTEI